MSITTAIAIYFLIWWVTLFAVLPFGVRSQQEEGEIVAGSDPGAPAVPRVLAKLAWTTLVATLVFGVCSLLYLKGLVTLAGLSAMLGR
jgi:predicted secreted protein